MNNKVQQEVSKQLVKQFLFQIIVYMVIIVGLSVIGYKLCSGRVWYEEDFLYPLIHTVHVHWFSIFLFLLLFGCMIITCINFLWISRTIKLITDAVNDIYADRTDPIQLPLQLHEVENQLNQIRMNVQSSRQVAHEAEQRKNDMVMYMAHDLKTPLTSVIGYLTLLQDEPEISEKVRQKYMGIILKKALRLEELINEFFEIARFNFSHMTLEVSKVNMSIMIEQILYEFKPLFSKKGLSYSLDAQKDIFVLCDVEKIERVFDNLFKNVVNYSYENTEIYISLRRNNSKGMKLVVENQGKTIPKEKLECIFEQFFRMDSSRASNTGGSGLGLAVVKEIVNLHKGTIICESENETIRFTITI